MACAAINQGPVTVDRGVGGMMSGDEFEAMYKVACAAMKVLDIDPSPEPRTRSYSEVAAISFKATSASPQSKLPEPPARQRVLPKRIAPTPVKGWSPAVSQNKRPLVTIKG